jgi:hypothetical protein
MGKRKTGFGLKKTMAKKSPHKTKKRVLKKWDTLKARAVKKANRYKAK